MNSKLILLAVADAKRIQKIALLDAKKKLALAFTPRIKSMLSDKIKSILSEDDDLLNLSLSVNLIDPLYDDLLNLSLSAYLDDDIDINLIVKLLLLSGLILDDEIILLKKSEAKPKKLEELNLDKPKPKKLEELNLDKPKPKKLEELDLNNDYDDDLDLDLDLNIEDGEITDLPLFNDDGTLDAPLNKNYDPLLDIDIEDDYPNTEDDLDIDIEDDSDLDFDDINIEDSDIDININDDLLCKSCDDNEDITFDDLDLNELKDADLKYAEKLIKKLQALNKRLNLKNKLLVKLNKTYLLAIEYFKYKMDLTKLANHKIGLVTQLFESMTLTQKLKVSILLSFDKTSNLKLANLVYLALKTKSKKVMTLGSGSSAIRSTKPKNTLIIKLSSNKNTETSPWDAIKQRNQKLAGIKNSLIRG